ncbi:amino acid permease/ SLC12A domain-containing protein [Gamsiella multidivaricata]|uniref:amino acid permease/ SLC12A domain-containing protein n=1 Tax=Gamsiella multidivaricata TaxID=101098 RepID=UPI00222094D3|nr:amino acid permease/ SLC12A domain-containing protein [Gamsiella multidivaricata]KAI7825714.1 amino acid permease/ SLC12A domain-containing protein [Gamsiella multidivaricata]
MDNVNEPGGLKRDLKQRHMVMIAISGTIGTGLFLTSGKTIATAGPLGALLAYMTIGVWLVFVCQAIGEIATLLPLPGAFTIWGARVFDEAFAFQMTWVYFTNWALTIPAELSASSLVVSFWLGEGSSFPTWVVPVIIIVALVIINMLGVKMYGEAEYWFSILKVVTIIVFIITGILVDAGAVGGTRYGVDNWHISGAPFKGGFKAFLSVLVSVGFAYGGTELSGVTAAESRNPHKHVPKAVNTVLVRIAFFYILSIFFLSCIVPNNDERLLNPDGTVVNAPFTIVFVQAGMKGGADYMNAVIFTSIVSASNSDFYVATRMLLSLANNGWAPKWVGKTNRRGVPYVAVGITTLFSCIALVMIYAGASVVFDWLVSIIGSIIFLIWTSILFLHFRFRQCWKAQGHTPEELPYRSWGYPYGHYLAMVVAVCCVVANFYLSIDSKPSVDAFTGPEDPDYIAKRNRWAQGVLGAWFPWFQAITLYFGWKLIKKTKIINPAMADLDTGRWIPVLKDPLMGEKPKPRWRQILSNFV